MFAENRENESVCCENNIKKFNNCPKSNSRGKSCELKDQVGLLILNGFYPRRDY